MPFSQIQNQLPGLDKIGGGVNTKTASYADWNSITSFLKLTSDPAKWEQVHVLSKNYNVPKGFIVAVGNRSKADQVIGSGRDTYMKRITASLQAGGGYGGFSGTVESSFDMTEDTTESYSFGTYTFEQQLYSLTLPYNLDGLLDPTFEADLKGLMSPTEFYKKHGTHYTSSILMGAKASLSLYSQFKSQYSDQTFKADLSAAYASVVGSFKTGGSFSYDSQQSSETYQSSSSLILVGGNTTKTTLADWQFTITDFPAFIDFNTGVSDDALVPIYKLLPVGSRYDQLKAALPDFLNPPLSVRIFCAASTQTEYPTSIVEVPNGYKILSGGAKVVCQGDGELLTASYPIGDNQWSAKAKDAVVPDKAILTVYAVAVYDPYNWLDVKVFSSVSTLVAHPTASISVDSDYAMTGGGAQTTYMGVGNYLTASYPASAGTWSVASKDHINSCPATITAYAIGVKWSSTAQSRFFGLHAITTQYEQASSNPNAHPESTVAAPSGTTTVGGGAFVDCGAGEGNMLFQSFPLDANNWYAIAKDHELSSIATLTVYAIGVRNVDLSLLHDKPARSSISLHRQRFGF